jgi:hypothetical protein
MSNNIRVTVIRSGPDEYAGRWHVFSKSEAKAFIMRAVRNWRRKGSGYTCPKGLSMDCSYEFKRHGKVVGDIYLSEGWV